MKTLLKIIAVSAFAVAAMPALSQPNQNKPGTQSSEQNAPGIGGVSKPGVSATPGTQDHQFDAAQTAPRQLAQERSPERLLLTWCPFACDLCLRRASGITRRFSRRALTSRTEAPFQVTLRQSCLL
jgi:hypothetical protein